MKRFFNVLCWIAVGGCVGVFWPGAQALAAKAVAGESQVAVSGNTVILNGSASTPTDKNGTLTYQWTFLRAVGDGPIPALTLVSDEWANKIVVTSLTPDATKPLDWGDPFLSFEAPVVASGKKVILSFGLVVADTTGTGAGTGTPQDVVNVTVISKSAPTDTQASTPVANAGSDLKAKGGEIVTLTASGTDTIFPGQLIYQWEFVQAVGTAQSSSTVLKLKGNSSLTTMALGKTTVPGGDQFLSFIAPDISNLEELSLVFGLTATNPSGNQSLQDLVVVTVNSGQTLTRTSIPIANPGSNRTVKSGDTVTLDGSASNDPVYGKLLTYQWTYLQTANKDLDVSPTITMESNEYNAASPPARMDKMNPGDATGKGDQFFSFKAPSVGNSKGLVMIFGLTVFNPVDNQSQQALVSVTIDPIVVPVSISPSVPPTANAGENKTVGSGATVTLDGSLSTDASAGNLLSYQWEYIKAVSTEFPQTTLKLEVLSPEYNDQFPPTLITLMSQGSKTGKGDRLFTFKAPVLGPKDGMIMVFSLTVYDLYGNQSSPDLVMVSVNSALGNQQPTAVPKIKILDGDGTAVTEVVEGQTVYLDGSESTDSDGTVAAYRWDVASPKVVLSRRVKSGKESDPTFVAPRVEVPTTLTFSLTVTDDKGLTSNPTTVSLTVRNSGLAMAATPADTVVIAAANTEKTPVGVGAVGGGSLVSVKSVHPSTLAANPQQPSSLPDGLLDFSIKVSQVGGLVVVPLYFNRPVPVYMTWWKYNSTSKTWTDYSSNFRFTNSERTAAVLTLVDGGIGDDDGKADGAISDPGGLGSLAGSSSSSSDGGSKGDTKVGCTLNPGGDFDPVLPILTIFSILYLFRRRYHG